MHYTKLIALQGEFLRNGARMTDHLHKFYSLPGAPFFVIWQAFYPMIESENWIRRLTDDVWRTCIRRGMQPDDSWFSCKPCRQAYQAAVRQLVDEQRAVLAHLAQHCDAALLEALDHHL